MAPRGFVAKAGAFAAGTALAGAAVFGGVAVAPTVTAGLSASVQHEVTLNAFPTFTESLQTLLDTLEFGTMGQVLGLFGEDISTSSTLAALLATLNPDGLTLDDVTNNLFSSDISSLLADVQIPIGGGATAALGEVPIDALIGTFIGGTGANESIGDVLTALGLGPYVGLLDLPFLDLSPNLTVAELLSDMLGIDSDTTLDSLVIGNGQTLGDATLGSLFGIDGSTPWDQFLDNMTVGGTIIDPDGTGILGDETLGALLTSLLGVGADPVTDATTLTDFLGDLGIFSMLGLG
ncbi:hypothetical protein ACT18_19240 [Mycolicibacter kumamotonensis]|uniref:Uncharacterized protein n=2 Tax=Mycolicibacter kumamotonensis TaxID=354243 RepID=A0A1B8SBN2_9MYCO|nr:hypothetical protein ACT18_19240 [Mycolicibacter kumamotonensis]